MTARISLIFVLAAPFLIGCQSGDPAPKMIAMVDAAPPQKRPPDWEHTKALMQRRAPAVGEAAPDFKLRTLDGEREIALSTFHPDQPRVLIFGSFT